MKNSIATVVVTYNRKELLVQCLDAILGQSYLPDQIFVIDNASTDGTEALLREKQYLKNSLITYILLTENTGGAGGFYEGMKRAYEGGYDWIWLMDDDGYPAADALEKLLEARSKLDMIGCAVLLPENTAQLSWTLIAFTKNKYFSPNKRIRAYDELVKASEEGMYRDYINCFNAALINRRVIQKIGYVLQELFIRGDEVEYFLRAREAGIKLGIKIDAFYYHPHQPIQFNRMKYFYAFRNTFYNYTRYRKNIYQPPLQSFYLIYMFIKYIGKTPSTSPKYLYRLLKAIALASQGKLIPYEN